MHSFLFLQFATAWGCTPTPLLSPIPHGWPTKVVIQGQPLAVQVFSLLCWHVRTPHMAVFKPSPPGSNKNSLCWLGFCLSTWTSIETIPPPGGPVGTFMGVFSRLMINVVWERERQSTVSSAAPDPRTQGSLEIKPERSLSPTFYFTLCLQVLSLPCLPSRMESTDGVYNVYQV